MKNYLNIGEMAELFGLNVQTLHYYEKIGIFTPMRRDANGYRKYQFDQVYVLASIRFLRKIGYSIEGIKAYLDSREPDENLTLLRQQSAKLKEEIGNLARMDEVILRKIDYIERNRAGIDTAAAAVKWFPERYYRPIGPETALYLDDTFYYYPTIAFYDEKGLKLFGAYMEASRGILAEERGKLKAIPAGNYVVGYHVGPYEGCPATFAALRQRFPDLTYTGTVLNFNIIDQFVERNPRGYITEVQLQLQE